MECIFIHKPIIERILEWLNVRESLALKATCRICYRVVTDVVNRGMHESMYGSANKYSLYSRMVTLAGAGGWYMQVDYLLTDELCLTLAKNRPHILWRVISDDADSFSIMDGTCVYTRGRRHNIYVQCATIVGSRCGFDVMFGDVLCQSLLESWNTFILCCSNTEQLAIFACVKSQGRNLQYVPVQLRDREMCLAACRNYGPALKWAPEEFMHKYPEIVWAAVRQNPRIVIHTQWDLEFYKTEEYYNVIRYAILQKYHLLRYYWADSRVMTPEFVSGLLVSRPKARGLSGQIARTSVPAQ
jgi:hypothetical protein